MTENTTNVNYTSSSSSSKIPKSKSRRSTSRSKVTAATSTTTTTTSSSSNSTNNNNKSSTTTTTTTTTTSSSSSTSPTNSSSNPNSSPPISTGTSNKKTSTMKNNSHHSSSGSSSHHRGGGSHHHLSLGGSKSGSSGSSSGSSSSMVLVADRLRGVYECDYCRMDISQMCRVRCAVCCDFDLCLDCFATTDPNAAGTIRAAAKAANLLEDDYNTDGTRKAGGTTSSTVVTSNFSGMDHDPHVHGYRVCDSTKFPLFPTLRGVTKIIPPPNHHHNQHQEENKTTTTLPNKTTGHDPHDTQQQQEENKDTQKETSKNETKTKPKDDQPSNDTTANNDEKTTQNNNNNNNKQDTKEEESNTNNNNKEESKKEVVKDEMQKKKEEDTTTTTTTTKKSKEDHSNNNNNNNNNNKVKGSKNAPPEAWMVTDDSKTAWTAEEDLRLLEAIGIYGLGNWTDIAEAMYNNGSNSGGSSTNNAKYAKRCMERYLDDFLGTYGHIVPPYTLVPETNPATEPSSPNTNTNTTDAVLDSNHSNSKVKPLQDDEISTTSGERKRKRNSKSSTSSSSSFVWQSSAAANTSTSFNSNNNNNNNNNNNKGVIAKKYKVVPTSTLHGYKHIWPNPYVIPGHTIGEDVGRDLAARAEQTYVKLSNSISQKKEAQALETEWRLKKLNQPGGPTVLPPRLADIQSLEGSELAGFMPRRGDFDMEWENDAEQILADMEFSPHDPPQDVALKLQIIQIYNDKLDEREKRKTFLQERHLLDYRKNQANDQALSPEDRDLVHRMRLFARFHKSQQEHNAFLQKLLQAKQLRKEIATLQMYRTLGMTTLAEAERYELDKSRREHHKHAFHQKEMELQEKAKKAAADDPLASSNAAAAAMMMRTGGPKLWKQYLTPRNTDRKNRKSINRGLTTTTTTTRSDSNITAEETKETTDTSDTITDATSNNNNNNNNTDTPLESKIDKDNQKETQQKKEETTIPMEVESSSKNVVKNDIRNSPGYSLLCPSEIGLCQRLSLLPRQYLEAKKALIRESITQGLFDEVRQKKSIIQIDIEKRDTIVEFVMKAGWISSKKSTTQKNPPTVAVPVTQEIPKRTTIASSTTTDKTTTTTTTAETTTTNTIPITSTKMEIAPISN